MPSAALVSAEAIAAGFHALSDPTRIEIVELLRDGELCVCELMDAIDAAQSRLSFHLKVLREAKIVTDRRDGRWVYYTLNPDAFGPLHDFLTHMPEAHSASARRAKLTVKGSCCE